MSPAVPPLANAAMALDQIFTVKDCSDDNSGICELAEPGRARLEAERWTWGRRVGAECKGCKADAIHAAVGRVER